MKAPDKFKVVPARELVDYVLSTQGITLEARLKLSVEDINVLLAGEKEPTLALVKQVGKTFGLLEESFLILNVEYDDTE